MKLILAQQKQEAIRALKKGGVALLPSDSSYGLCTPFDSPSGKQRILKLKVRTDRKFVAIASSLKQVEQFFSNANKPFFRKVAREVWPGPVSLVVTPLLSVRVPAMPLLRHVAQEVGRPIISSSANISGQPPAFSVQQAREQIDLHQIDAILDVGRLPKRSPSAVVSLVRGRVEVIRPGSREAQQVLKRFSSWGLTYSALHL